MSSRTMSSMSFFWTAIRIRARKAVADARAAYFDRVEQLEAKGYLDATAG